MTQSPPVKVNILRRPDFRESYANSVQMRVNLWDFYLEFGTVNQTNPEEVNIETFQGIYVSPQQAKALLNVLSQNMTQYEATFGEIKLDPRAASGVVQ
jgi:flagellar protein FlaG